MPIFTEGAFGWKPAYCGIMLGVLGLTAPLVNFSVGGLASRGLPDRIITVRPRAAAARRAGARPRHRRLRCPLSQPPVSRRCVRRLWCACALAAGGRRGAITQDPMV